MAITEPVERLRRVCEIGVNAQPETTQNVASEVISACCGLAQWLNASHAPRGFEKAEAEIGAAAGVYRNPPWSSGAWLMQIWSSDQRFQTSASGCWNRATTTSRRSPES